MKEYTFDDSTIMKAIDRAVCDAFGLVPEQLQTKTRSMKFVFPRQICMTLARELSALSYVAISNYYGKKDHCTTFHACTRINDLIKRNPNFANAYEKMREATGYSPILTRTF